MILVVNGIIICQNRVLLLQRSPGAKMYPFEWCHPGGKVEQNETAESAIIREVIEEIGWVTLPNNWTYLGASTHGDCNFVHFLLKLDCQMLPVKLSEKEHCGYGWFAPFESIRMTEASTWAHLHLELPFEDK